MSQSSDRQQQAKESQYGEAQVKKARNQEETELQGSLHQSESSTFSSEEYAQQPAVSATVRNQQGQNISENMHYNHFMQQQQQNFYILQQQYMYNPNSPTPYPNYQGQWNPYHQYQHYAQMYEHFRNPHPSDHSKKEDDYRPSVPESEPKDMKRSTIEQAEANMESIKVLSLQDTEDTIAHDDSSKMAPEPSSSKSWADVARDRPQVDAFKSDINRENTQAISEDETFNTASYSQGSPDSLTRFPRGAPRYRAGRQQFHVTSRFRLAGRRGLTLPELQAQAQQLIITQRLVASANQIRVEPSILYQSQMTQYFYPYGGYMPMNYTTPGSVALDEHSYPFLELLRLYPHLVSINQTTVVPNPANARYFVLACNTESEAHAGIKYSRWKIPEEYGSMLNQAFGEVSGLGPLYVFIVLPAYKRCLGMAEVVSPASPLKQASEMKADGNEEKPDSHEEKEGTTNSRESSQKEGQEKALSFELRWLCVKDMHLGLFRRAGMLEEKQSVKVPLGDSDIGVDSERSSSWKPMYELESSQGLQALQTVLEQPVVSTMLLDFKMFDEGELTGQMPSYYKPGFFLPGQPSGGRVRGVYGRGARGRGSNFYGRGRGIYGENGTYRGSFRRGRGRNRGRGVLAAEDTEPRSKSIGGRHYLDQNKFEAPIESTQRDRPRKLVSGDGAEISLEGRYQFEVQRKVRKSKKGKKEDTSGSLPKES